MNHGSIKNNYLKMCVYLVLAKLAFKLKMNDFLATPLFTETITQGDHIIFEWGKV